MNYVITIVKVKLFNLDTYISKVKTCSTSSLKEKKTSKYNNDQTNID